jgi:hypothetical protein
LNQNTPDLGIPDSDKTGKTLIALGLIFLLGYFGTIVRNKPDHPKPVVPPPSLTAESAAPERLKRANESLKNELEEAHEVIKELRSAPNYTTVEKAYFNANGIANSGLILSIALLIWEFLRLRDSCLPSISAVKINDEIGAVMATLALAILTSSIVVAIAHVDKGRSHERINRAFFVSMVISMAAFLIFAMAVPHAY